MKKQNETKSENIEPSEESREIPAVRFDQPEHDAAREIGMILAKAPIFRFGESFVTVCHERGELEPMTPDRFRSWVGSYLYMIEYRIAGYMAAPMTRDFADMVLASDYFRKSVREIQGINKVRLPAWRGETEVEVFRGGPFWHKEGSDLRVELLPPGYDCLLYTSPSPRDRG